jgi:hypothetical protein
MQRVYVLCLCLVDPGDQLFGQRLAVDLHGVAVGAAAAADGDVGQRLACLVSLARHARNHARGGIVLVERRAELLSCLRQLLLERVCLEHNGVPLVLEGAEQRGDRREVRRTRGDDLRRLQLNQVLDGELFAGDGICVVLGDVCLDQALLEDVPAFARGNGLPGRFSRNGAEHVGVCVVDWLRRVVLLPSATFLRKARDGARAIRLAARRLRRFSIEQPGHRQHQRDYSAEPSRSDIA